MARSWRARRETSIPARLGFSSRIAHTRHAARHRSPIYRVGAEAPLPLIPAHSASSRAFTPVFDGLWTRVNALMLGIQEELGPRLRVWSRRIGERLERRDVAETFEAGSIVVVHEAVEESIAVGVGDKEAV